MLRFTIAKHLEQLFFFGTISVMGLSFGRRKGKQKLNRYSTMHKAKINFSEVVEGLKNNYFSFKDHVFLKINRISLLCNPLPVSLTQLQILLTLDLSIISKSLSVHEFKITSYK